MVDIQYKHFNVIVIGSGASGFNAANKLFDYGVKDVCLITENLNIGTSRNSGSDKQTYYKLSLAGDELDSVEKMAMTYYEGLSEDGDIAKVEAAGSVEAFMNLVNIGVDFPRNMYGEYIGYKTDHDPLDRATSAGPYTSRQMTEKLEEEFIKKDIELLDKNRVIKIFTKDDKFEGVLTLGSKSYNLITANCMIYATGGPGGLYQNSVYPYGQIGANGIAFLAGVKGKNLAHFQYGIASVSPKWNVSGTYMQSLPRFFSVDDEGEEHEFLEEYFVDRFNLYKNIFLKGYQWPFDSRKLEGSSIIDYYVYIEEVIRGRKVYLDYTNNPSKIDIDFEKLDSVTKKYLEDNGAFLNKPVDRLIKMNEKAYEFYLDHNIDLKIEPLEISLSAQHNNGGLLVDINYETNIKNFFAIGECASCHGIYRPGGSALNSGQVGSIRAAREIKRRSFDNNQVDLTSKAKDFIEYIEITISKESNVLRIRNELREEMSEYAACFRDISKLEDLIEKRRYMMSSFTSLVKSDRTNLIRTYELYDLILSQLVYLESFYDYSKRVKSRIGGFVNYNEKLSTDQFKDQKFVNEVQITEYFEDEIKFMWRNVKPIPKNENVFEIEWKKYSERENNE